MGRSPTKALALRQKLAVSGIEKAIADGAPDFGLLMPHLDLTAVRNSKEQSDKAVGYLHELQEVPLTSANAVTLGEGYADAFKLRAAALEMYVDALERLRNRIITALEGPGEPRLAWDEESGELTLDGKVIRRVGTNAPRLREILNRFQKSKWTRTVELCNDGDDQEALGLKDWDDQEVREKVALLNKGLSGIVFNSASGRGPKEKPVPTVKWSFLD